MLAKVRKTIEDYGLLARKDRVVAALSGGADSVALLKILIDLAGTYDLFLVAAHLNHGLRGDEADREELFAGRLAQSLGVAFVSRRIAFTAKRSGRSLEELCRVERYAFLTAVAKEWGATKIALGHHLQDQAETVLMNFLRGSGTEGLRGMLPIREEVIIRPLLRVTRKEILTFLAQQGLPFIHDSSNDQDCFLRNRIRHDLIPHVKEAFNPQFEENLARTAEIMRLEDHYLEQVAARWLKQWGLGPEKREKVVSLKELLELHEAIRHRIIKTLLVWTARDGKRIGYKHVLAVADLAKNPRGSRCLDLPGGIVVCREYERLCFLRTRDPVPAAGRQAGAVSPDPPFFHYTVDIPGQIAVPEAGMTISFQLLDGASFSRGPGQKGAIYLDYEALHLPLIIRNSRPGDRIAPWGMEGTKKLKAFFIDEKVPRRQRSQTPILTDQETILWIVGKRMSGRRGVTDRTERVLKVEIV